MRILEVAADDYIDELQIAMVEVAQDSAWSAGDSRRVVPSENYFVHIAQQLQQEKGRKEGFKVLVFRCAEGRIIRAGLAAGLQIYGADPYDGYHEWCLDEVAKAGLLDKNVFQMTEGKIPFADQTFDLVVANRLEHVSDLDPVLAEIDRVLRPDGKVLAIFPNANVVWEEHSNTFFTHWFPANSSIRFPWIYLSKWVGDALWKLGLAHMPDLARRSLMGMGADSEGRTRSEWTRFALWYLDNYCFYRKQAVIDEAFERYFEVKRFDRSFIAFRRARSRGWRLLTPFPAGWALNERILRKLIGVVVLATKATPA